MEQYPNKPNVNIKAKWIIGNQQKLRTSMPQWDEGLRNAIGNVINKKGYFSHYIFDKDTVDKDAVIFNRDNNDPNSNKKNVDYTIEVIVYNSFDKDWTDWIPIVHLFSLGLVPVYYTNELIVTVKVYDHEGKQVHSAQNSVIGENWISIWFIPVSFVYSPSSAINLVPRQIDTLFKQTVEQNVFKHKKT